MLYNVANAAIQILVEAIEVKDASGCDARL